MYKVFIDGKAGTTGLRIYDRLKVRDDIELLTLPEDQRKDPESRRKMLNSADIVFLCLPDTAAIEAVSMITNPETVVIDTSTAHRTNPDWVYAFPELSQKHKEDLGNSKRIAVPGCHASGFIALIYPLIEKGILRSDALLTCHSLTGYSGGGKKMIEQYRDSDRDILLSAPRQYAFGQTHKHLPEMQAVCNLNTAPIFCPIVADFYSGMEVTVPIFRSQLKDGVTACDIKNVYCEKYKGPVVFFDDCTDDGGMLSAAALSSKDSMKIYVNGNGDRILLTAVYDNLGKGASGAAIETMNIIINGDLTEGLDL